MALALILEKACGAALIAQNSSCITFLKRVGSDPAVRPGYFIRSASTWTDTTEDTTGWWTNLLTTNA